jgi:acyl dehydratase
MAVDRDFLLGLGEPRRRFSYAAVDTIRYALSCGLGDDPLDGRQLPFVYERDLVAFPTLPCVLTPGFDTLMNSGLDYSRILHAEQRLTIHNPLPPEGEIVASWAVDEVIDKGPGKGLLITHHVDIEAPDGTPLARIRRAAIARGDGGLGGPSTGGFETHVIPDRPADRSVSLRTLPQMALMYRLNGDRNPLHADPEAARRAGFPGPLLHGLCAYAVAGRAILESWCDFDPSRLASLDARFAAPVYPGETLRIDMWRDEDGAILFEVAIPERKVVALRGGRAGLRPAA